MTTVWDFTKIWNIMGNQKCCKNHKMYSSHHQKRLGVCLKGYTLG